MLSDLATDSHTAPSLIRIRIRKAKNDPFGASVTLGLTGKALCPVTDYLSIRPPSPGPLFICHNSVPLLRDQFVLKVKESLQALQAAGLDHSMYSEHSFRIGAAAAAGIPTHLIQTMGRWSSDAYHLFIRTPPELLVAFSGLSAVLLTIMMYPPAIAVLYFSCCCSVLSTDLEYI